MPKLFCPCCGRRCADVPNKDFKNKSRLVQMESAAETDFILECPHCHRKIGLHIDNLWNVIQKNH